MGLLFKTLLLVLVFTSFSNKECKLMPDGKYIIKHTGNSPYPESRLKVKKGRFEQSFNNGSSETGKLIWVYESLFKLEPDSPPKEDTTELGKLLSKSFGDLVFGLQEKKGDTLFFRMTYSGNLHITKTLGYLLKVD
jgi:hypothetical protein